MDPTPPVLSAFLWTHCTVALHTLIDTLKVTFRHFEYSVWLRHDSKKLLRVSPAADRWGCGVLDQGSWKTSLRNVIEYVHTLPTIHVDRYYILEIYQKNDPRRWTSGQAQISSALLMRFSELLSQWHRAAAGLLCRNHRKPDGSSRVTLSPDAV